MIASLSVETLVISADAFAAHIYTTFFEGILRVNSTHISFGGNYRYLGNVAFQSRWRVQQPVGILAPAPIPTMGLAL